MKDPMPKSARRNAEANAQTALQVGWLAKGFVFVVIGLLGLEVAWRGFSTNDADQKGALEALVEYPVGRVAVFAVSIGLLAYAAWQVWAAITQDHEDDEMDPGELIHQLKRVGWIGLGLVYALLAVTGVQIALKENGSSQTNGGPTSPSGLASRLMDLPAGQILVGTVGLGTMAVGLYQLIKGLRRNFLDDIETASLQEWQVRALRLLGATGFIARASLMGVAGWLLVDAARKHAPERAAGIDQSLDALAGAPGGQVLLAMCSLGLIAAGAYDMLTYRRQRVDELA